MMEEFVMADNPKFMERIRIQWDRCPELASSYVGRIPCIRNIDELIFHSNVVFFCGRNGTGKSTLLEAIALAYGMNPEGGYQHFQYGVI